MVVAIGGLLYLARTIRIESFPGCRLEASSASLGHHSATVARDLQFFLCGHNLNLVCSEAQEFEAAGGYGSYVMAVLSDSAGEDEKVDAFEERGIRTDHLAHGNSKYI
jgi:hypothetical protein